MWMPIRVFVVVATALMLAACNSSQPGMSPAAPVASDDHDHDHDHDHAHEALGPHGGHLVELGEEEYHLEWTHDDDSGLVTVYVLDAAGKESVGIPAETITIATEIDDTAEYKLTAVSPTGEPPVASQFELKDPALIQNLKMAGQGVEATVSLQIGDKLYTGKFEHHEHSHDHDHAH